MSQPAQQQYNELRMKFVQLSQRERLLSLFAGLALILLGGYVLFVEPVLIDLDKKQMATQRQQSEAQRFDEMVNEVQRELGNDPNAPLNARLSQIQQQIADLDARLAAQTRDLVPAQRMPQLLENVLSESKKLKLLSMHSIAPTELLSLDQQDAVADINLFQHGVRLSLEGSYFDIQNYLREVEQLPWRFYWKKFHYQVTDYPKAEVLVEIYTLSTSKAFIGVAMND